jgi:hypothetical protein
MNKKIRTMTAVMLCSAMLAASACSKKEQPAPAVQTTAAPSAAASSEAPSASGSDASAPSSSEEPLAPVMASSGQLDAIFKAKATWFVEGDAEMRYAITDLDMNGRYEITAAKKNKVFNVYEVNSDGSGIDKVTTTFEQGAPGPYMEDEYDLRINSNGEYLYVAREYDDATVENEVTIYYYVMSLSNGKLRANQIATEIRTTDESGKVSSRYGDEEFEMTEKEFREKTETGLPKIEYKQKVSWTDGNAVAGMNDAKALEAICFKLVK